jgi:uncharacterized protein DUF973/zinc ribbon protein
MPFCPACGHSILDNALYCPACGKQLSTTKVVPGMTPPPPPPNSTYIPIIPSAFGEADKKALRKVTIFSAAFLASIVISFVSTLTLLDPFKYILPANGNPPSTTSAIFDGFGTNFLTILAVTSVVGLVFETIIFLQLYSAFKSLAKVDRPRFRIPSVLTLLLVISVPILLVGDLIVISGFVPFFNSIGQGVAQQISSLPQGYGTFAAGGFIAFIGGIVAFVSIIGGPMLGLWRMGSRYESTSFKVAAIFFIIPGLDIIAPILLLVGAHQANNKIFPQKMS